MLAAVCHDWGDNWAGKWGGPVPTEERLSSHPAWVIAAYHWLLLPDIPRIECDDYLGGVSPGDFWKVFVRQKKETCVQNFLQYIPCNRRITFHVMRIYFTATPWHDQWD